MCSSKAGIVGGQFLLGSVTGRHCQLAKFVYLKWENVT